MLIHRDLSGGSSGVLTGQQSTVESQWSYNTRSLPMWSLTCHFRSSASLLRVLTSFDRPAAAMSNNNRNRSTPSTSGGSGGREVNRPHRRNTDHAQTGSSSARSQRGNDRSASSSVSLNGTGGQAPDTDHRQTHLRPGWIMRDGHWYYHTSDGRSYRWEDNVDSVVQDAGEYHGVPVDNNGVPNDDRAYRSWDESSQRANQGSAYVSRSFKKNQKHDLTVSQVLWFHSSRDGA